MELAALPEELQELVRKQLDTGRYTSVDDLLCEAVRVHSEQEAYFEANREQFRSKIARGVAQAERGELREGGEAMDDIRHRMLTRRSRGG